MEQNDFLKDLQPSNEVFDQDITTDQKVETPEDLTEEPEVRDNRETRRLRAKLQAERESSIALAARLEALTEAQKFRESQNEADYIKSVERIYGTGSPEAIEATELLKKALLDVEKTATEKALEAFREEQKREAEKVLKEEQVLDSMIEEIEDEYGVSLDATDQKSFFRLLEKLSPKDSNGNVIEYADHHAVWEEFQVRKSATSNRAKELASRSMTRTGASPSTTVEMDANERWLREHGII